MDGLSNLKHLVTLNLENNRIQIVSGVKGLDELNNLNLKGNQIEHVDYLENIKCLPSLCTLNISKNKMKGAHFFLQGFGSVPMRIYIIFILSGGHVEK